MLQGLDGPGALWCLLCGGAYPDCVLAMLQLLQARKSGFSLWISLSLKNVLTLQISGLQDTSQVYNRIPVSVVSSIDTRRQKWDSGDSHTFSCAEKLMISDEHSLQ